MPTKRKPPFNVDCPEDSCGLLLWQTTTIWSRMIKKALDPYNIAHSQFVILAILMWCHVTKERPTQIAIARFSKLDKMTVSKGLKKLAALGYIAKSTNKQDTRSKTIKITDLGIMMASKLVPIVEEIDSQFFGVVSEQNQHNLAQILNYIAVKNSQN